MKENVLNLVIFLFSAVVSSSAENYCKLNCPDIQENNVCVRQSKNCAENCGYGFRALNFDNSVRKLIVDRHNELRNKVALGQQAGLPAASNMKALGYNLYLEKSVRCWVDTCQGNPAEREACEHSFEHENVGRNFATKLYWESEPDINSLVTSVIQKWYDEVKYFDPKWVIENHSDARTSNFTQLIWADSLMIGCAAATYSSHESTNQSHIAVMACDYGPIGNKIGSPIYHEGPAAHSEDLELNSKFKGLCGHSS